MISPDIKITNIITELNLIFLFLNLSQQKYQNF